MTKPLSGLDAPFAERGEPLLAERKNPEPDTNSAGMFSRFIAFGIDFMLIALFTVALADISLLFSSLSGEETPFAGFLFVLIFIFFNIFFLSYFIWCYTSGGKTLGKMVLGIKVVALNGGRLGLFRSTFRSFGYYPSSFFFAGFFWAIFDKDNQGWHDKLAGTVVVEDN